MRIHTIQFSLDCGGLNAQTWPHSKSTRGNRCSVANGKFLEFCSKSFTYYCHVICLGPLRARHWLITNKIYSNMFIMTYQTPQILQFWKLSLHLPKQTDQSDGNWNTWTCFNLLFSAQQLYPSWGLFKNKVNIGVDQTWIQIPALPYAHCGIWGH